MIAKLVAASQFLSNLADTGEDAVRKLLEAQNINIDALLNYINYTDAVLVWDEPLVYAVDYLMLDARRLINHYKMYGEPKLLDALTKYRLISGKVRGKLFNKWPDQRCAIAAKYGQIELLQQAVKEGYPLTSNVCKFAALNGNLAVLQWARENGCPWDAENLCESAVQGENLEVLQWVHANGCLLNNSIFQDACISGNLAIVQWLISKGCITQDRFGAPCAASYGHVELLKWLHNSGHMDIPSMKCSISAIRSGKLELVKWLYNIETAAGVVVGWDVYATRAAAHGHTNILLWVLEESSPLNLWVCIAAEYHGDIHITRLVLAAGYLPSSTNCMDLAFKGFLNELQQTVRLGCKLNEHFCVAAARGGHLEILIWLREQGCDWNSSVCTAAAHNGHLAVLQWARAHGCPLWDSNVCSEAARGGHLHVLQWARAHGCPWDANTCGDAAAAGHLHVLQWARANGCPWNEYTAENAAMCGQLEVVQWLVANGCTFNIPSVLSRVRSYPVFQWLEALLNLRKRALLEQEKLIVKLEQLSTEEMLKKL